MASDLSKQAQKQLIALENWLLEARAQVEANLHIRLWNGKMLPMSDNVTSSIVLAINSPDAVRRLIFSPRMMTLVELYAQEIVDIEGGAPLDAVRCWDHMQVLNFARGLSKRKLMQMLWPFVRKLPMARNPTDGEYDVRVKDRFEAGRNDQDLIAHHYDVSNDFYRLFLDPEMIYSCGYFQTPQTSLADAQQAKLDQICRKLHLRSGDRLLDIGCGWGGLACHAARNYGVHVHGVTLSQEQHDFAVEKVKRLGLEKQVEIELKDYRAIEAKGQYDKVSQVEMFEHLGLDNHDHHFQHVHDLLRPRGVYFHQASTRLATKNLKAFRKPTAYLQFIRRFIFPGGELDHVGLTVTNMERFRFEVHDVEGMREHFSMTLEHWVQRLWDNREEASALVGWPRTRLWLLYMSMAAMGFDRAAIGLFQVVGSRRRTGPAGLPLTR